VLNSGFLGVQFWDGRAPDLVEQAKGPILNPVEMKMPDEKSVEDKLAKDALYPKEFAEAFLMINPPGPCIMLQELLLHLSALKTLKIVLTNSLMGTIKR
jgi:hypothetical protein